LLLEDGSDKQTDQEESELQELEQTVEEQIEVISTRDINQ